MIRRETDKTRPIPRPKVKPKLSYSFLKMTYRKYYAYMVPYEKFYSTRESRTNHNAGFTLIELLVVIAVISLLVSILLPTLNQAKDLAKQSVCLTNLKGIGIALAMYRGSYHDDNPYLDVVDESEGKPMRWAAKLVQTEMIDNPGGIMQCPYSEITGLAPHSGGRYEDDGKAYPYCTYLANCGIFKSNSPYYTKTYTISGNWINASSTVHAQCYAMYDQIPRDAWGARMASTFGWHGDVHRNLALTVYGDGHAGMLDVDRGETVYIYDLYDRIDGMAFNYEK